jgi:hypothetical protein
MTAAAQRRPVAFASAGSPADADGDYPQRCLYEVWEELTARGFVMDEPLADGSCQCFITNLRTAQCEMDLLVSGALVWEYMPLAGTPRPDQAACLVLALLSGTSPASRSLLPASCRGLAPGEAAGRALAACGMAVRLVDVGYDHDEVSTEVEVANPSEPGRGHVRISDHGNIRWECLFAPPAGPAGGLAPLDVAQAIATALAGHRAARQDHALHSGLVRKMPDPRAM